MNQTEWESYISKTITKFKSSTPKNRDQLRKFLSQNNYSKNSREYISEQSGSSARGKAVSVEKTVTRLNKKVRENTRFISLRNKEVDDGKYSITINHIDTNVRELQKRARTIVDAKELSRVKSDLEKMLDVQKRVRKASNDIIENELKNAIKEMSNIRYSRALRSSLNSQVKRVVNTEKTRSKGDIFYDSVKRDDTLIDVVLSASHVIYDICDEVANASPYTKDNLPALPLHPNCKCRYKHHNSKNTTLNNKRKGMGSQKKSNVTPELAKNMYQ